MGSFPRPSQVVKVLLEIFIPADGLENLTIETMSEAWFFAWVHATIDDVMVVSDLVSILARSWYFDGARPIGVHVAELVSEVLDVSFRKVLRFIETDVEMSRSDASLGCLLRHEEKVEADVVLLVLDQALIDDATWWRVADIIASFWSLDEHALVDSLVHDYQSDGRNRADLVVEWLENLLELADFTLDDLVSHAFADSISVDNDSIGIGATMVLGKRNAGLLHALIEISLDKFLPLLLDDESGEVLGKIRVDGCSEADD